MIRRSNIVAILCGVATFFSALTSLAVQSVKPKIAIVDLGFVSEINDFGAMSDPRCFKTALGDDYDVRLLKGLDLGKAKSFNRENTDVLVIPCGSAWPVRGTDNLLSFLKAGGALFACGGYAFDTPVDYDNGKWTPVAAHSTGGVPQINTRNGYRVRDCIDVRSDQIGVFDAAYKLNHVSRIVTAEDMDGVCSCEEFALDVSGYSATGQLGINGHGFYDNRATWRPILNGYDAEGRYRGAVGAFLRHNREDFEGSSWAIFGVDNADLFSENGPCFRLIKPVVRRLLDKTFISHVKPKWPCYRLGEEVELSAEVKNGSSVGCCGSVLFTLSDENGRVLKAMRTDWNLKAYERRTVRVFARVEADFPDEIHVAAELMDDAQNVLDREHTAFVIWSLDVVSRGPHLTRVGSLLKVNDEARFQIGAQTYWGQKQSYSATSPLTFIRDFKAMAEMGLTWTRCFLPWNTEWDRRFSDMVVQLSQKNGLVLYHCQQYADVSAEGDALENIARMFSDIACRYKDIPGFAIDLRNEPYLMMPPSQRSVARMTNWVNRCVDEIHKQAPNMLVSLGWGQGWAGGKASKDPILSSMALDFTDRHYYGVPEEMPQHLKDIDLRAYGKPFVLAECGSKDHPTYLKHDRVNGDDPESYARKFRYLVSHVFGLGGSAVLAWVWRDPLEGIFPCGLMYSTGAPRLAADDFSNLGKAFRAVKLAQNNPDVVIVMSEEPRFSDTSKREKYIRKVWTIDRSLQYWGANWCKVTASAPAITPVRLCLDPKTLPDDEVLMRERVGRLLLDAGCQIARKESDPTCVDVMRVPGEDDVAWVFWNGGRQTEVVSRGEVSLPLSSGRVGLIRISNKGRLLLAKEY